MAVDTLDEESRVFESQYFRGKKIRSINRAEKNNFKEIFCGYKRDMIYITVT